MPNPLTNTRPRRPVTAARSVFAALDLGTNNCRLLIARPTADDNPQGFEVIDAFSRIVRLGEGLTQNHALSDAAMARTVSALRICGGKMRRHRVTRARAVATEACRQASNCQQFLTRVERETGIKIEIISSGEEARLAVAGCAALLDPNIPNALVFDIGGGSTELIWLALEQGQPQVLDQISLPLGVVNLTELYGGDRVSDQAYVSMMDRFTESLAAFDAANGITEAIAAGRVQMLGSSGTVTTLSGIYQQLPRYDRSQVDGSWLALTDARDIAKRLRSLDMAERARQPCVGRDRADLVVAGCAVLEAIWERWPLPRLRIADRGVREGILAELLA